MKAKGHDWRISVLADGREIKAFRNFTSAEIDFGLRQQTVQHVGEADPRIEGYNDAPTFGCPFEPDSKEYIDLLDLQRQKNLPNATRRNLRIDVTCSVDFGDGGRSRVMLEDCTLHDAGLSISERATTNTSSSPTFTARRWKKLS